MDLDTFLKTLRGRFLTVKIVNSPPFLTSMLQILNVINICNPVNREGKKMDLAKEYNEADGHHVYIIQNLVNDKKYVGKTSKGYLYRTKQHVIDAIRGSNCTIHRAIRKYGIDNFIVWPVGVYETDKQACIAEKLLIRSLNTFGGGSDGYNSTLGGDGSWGLVHSDAAKRKMSQAKSGDKHPNFGKTLSDEARRKISESLRGENNPLYGRTGDKCHRSKAILVDGVRYGSQREAARILDIPLTTIRRHLKSPHYPNYQYAT